MDRRLGAVEDEGGQDASAEGLPPVAARGRVCACAFLCALRAHGGRGDLQEAGGRPEAHPAALGRLPQPDRRQRGEVRLHPLRAARGRQARRGRGARGQGQGQGGPGEGLQGARGAAGQPGPAALLQAGRAGGQGGEGLAPPGGRPPLRGGDRHRRGLGPQADRQRPAGALHARAVPGQEAPRGGQHEAREARGRRVLGHGALRQEPRAAGRGAAGGARGPGRG
mmetsp:Transcript_64365/g.207378  ORF Transcript_64365/g.207378 Transcript_64365/m.207378 type:complete len:224 (-) Transcript_64365:418-1089(-)